MHDNDPTIWYCRWCGALDAGHGRWSALQPAFCLDCVAAMLRGDGSCAARKATPWLLRQRELRAAAIRLGLPISGLEVQQ